MYTPIYMVWYVCKVAKMVRGNWSGNHCNWLDTLPAIDCATGTVRILLTNTLFLSLSRTHMQACTHAHACMHTHTHPQTHPPCSFPCLEHTCRHIIKNNNSCIINVCQCWASWVYHVVTGRRSRYPVVRSQDWWHGIIHSQREAQRCHCDSDSGAAGGR